MGLGPAGPELLGDEARRLLGGDGPRVLRTSKHPAAVDFGHLESFDYLYEKSESFEELYGAIVDRLVEMVASSSSPVVYGVPGSPLVAERTVELLRSRSDVHLETVPGVSFLDLAWERVRVDPLAASVQLVDASEFTFLAAGRTGPFLVAQCWSRELLSQVKLSASETPSERPVILHHLGLKDEAVLEVPWEEMDRSLVPDHLTSLWIPRLTSPVQAELARLEELTRVLRERCPWDAEQTHASLARYLREESFEALDAIASLGEDGEGAEDLEEELGDVLFQVFFHSRLGAEEGLFDLAGVARHVHDKLVRRHPHVFGDEAATSADAVSTRWEEAKRQEKGRASVLDGIPADLPALAYLQAIERRSSSLVAGSVERSSARSPEEPLDPPRAAGNGPIGKTPPVEDYMRPLDEAGLADLLHYAVRMASELRLDAEEVLRARARVRAAEIRALEEDGAQEEDGA